MSATGYEDFTDVSPHCAPTTELILGERCKYLTTGQSLGLCAGLVLGLAVVIFVALVVLRFLVLAFNHFLNKYLQPAASIASVQYTWHDRWGAFSWGGMERYRDIQRAEEEDRIFKEKVARDGWESVEIPFIKGWNCGEARERERMQNANMPRGRDEEEGGDRGESMGMPPHTIHSSRGGRLSPALSDDESDKQIAAKSFGKGSSNSGHGSIKKLSQRKR